MSYYAKTVLLSNESLTQLEELGKALSLSQSAIIRKGLALLYRMQMKRQAQNFSDSTAQEMASPG